MPYWVPISASCGRPDRFRNPPSVKSSDGETTRSSSADPAAMDSTRLLRSQAAREDPARLDDVRVGTRAQRLALRLPAGAERLAVLRESTRCRAGRSRIRGRRRRGRSSSGGTTGSPTITWLLPVAAPHAQPHLAPVRELRADREQELRVADAVLRHAVPVLARSAASRGRSGRRARRRTRW